MSHYTIDGYFANGKKFDTLAEAAADMQRWLDGRAEREAAELAAQQERRRKAKRRAIRARYGYPRPLATRKGYWKKRHRND